METIIPYVIKVNVALIVFYALYKLAFQKDTFFMFRRWYLIAAILFSFIYSLLPVLEVGEIFNFRKSIVGVQGTVFADLDTAGATLVEDESSTLGWFSWSELLKLVLVSGSAFLLLRFVWQIFSIIKLKRKSESRCINNVSYQHIDFCTTPFSFFKWIFVCPEAHTEDKLKQILIHEQIHANGWHTIDILLVEILKIVFWWNPVSWLLKREVAINLEYIADSGVLEEGFNLRDYQYNLLHLTYQEYNAQIVNNFNVSQLKQRIIMMNSTKTPIRKMAKYLAVLPIAFMFIATNSVYAQKNEPQKKEDKKGDLKVIGVKAQNDSLGNAVINKDSFTFVVEKEGVTQVKKELLVIIDGVKMEKGFDLNTLNPDEIESIKVLKESSATEAYDDDGKNGVILYTTKSAKRGESDEGVTANGDDVFVVVEDQPEFPGGFSELMKFLEDNVVYPAEAVEKGIEGRVIVRFIVEKDGGIDTVEILRGVDPSIDAEAVRVIKFMPNWKPGMHRGQTVRVAFTLPIVFSIPKKVE